jgi:hypothetical protein
MRIPSPLGLGLEAFVVLFFFLLLLFLLLFG